MTRKFWLILFAVAAVFAAACSSRRAPSEAERLGSASAELFANGLPCGAATQCTSGNCIDGVCCDTTCGGGARDLFACSNIYGAVPGLVNGTCKALVAGNACGSLTTINPCTWRGTVVNGGNNCPNPPGGASACFPCATSADCSGGFPTCVNGACVACTGDSGSVTAAPCPVSTPACSNGACTQCSTTNVTACAGATPTCNTATGTCATCNGDKGSGATRACQTGGAPACLANGACATCSATNATACNGGTPTCDTATSTCVACNGDNTGATTEPCPTSVNPYCNLAGGNAGSCGKCTSDLDCGVGHTGLSCNLATGACANICATDAQCAPGGWCPPALLVCVPKVANGQPVPNVAPVNGACTVANGTRVCQSGVCSTADNLCGLPNGTTCGPPTTNASCRSGTCFPGDNKCGLPAGQPCVTQNDCRSLVCPPSNKCGDCANDAACGTATSGKVCDDTAKTCGNGCRGVGGNGCAPGTVCTSTSSAIGKCVACLLDATCGSMTSGQVCNASHTCQAGCRGADGNGCPANLTCSSADGSIGVCTQCTTDSQCGGPASGQVCNDQKTCQVGCRGTGGNACAAGQVCSSTTNDIGSCGPPAPGGPDAGPGPGPGPTPGCTSDASCGSPTSGRICDPASKECTDGCRGAGGNSCAAGQVCSSTTSSAGACAPQVDDAVLEGGGFGCALSTRNVTRGRVGEGLALLLLGAVLVARRSRRKSARAADGR